MHLQLGNTFPVSRYVCVLGGSSYWYNQILQHNLLLVPKDARPWDWHLGQEAMCAVRYQIPAQ